MCGRAHVYIKAKLNTVILGDRVMDIFISYFHFTWLSEGTVLYMFYTITFIIKEGDFFLMVLQINPIKTTLSVVQKNQLRTMQLCSKLRLLK